MAHKNKRDLLFQEFQKVKYLIREENEILTFLSFDSHISKTLQKKSEWKLVPNGSLGRLEH